MSQAQHLELARRRTSDLVDQLIVLFGIHEANRFIVYSDGLAGQIPRSRAANAFNVFQDSSLLFELMRLTVLWDRNTDTKSIPCVVHHLRVPGVLANLKEVQEPSPGESEFHRRLRQRAFERLLRAIAWAERLQESQRMISLMNFRDKNLAHALEQTRREKKGQVIPPPKYGAEGSILIRSVVIVDAFHRCLNGSEFDWQGSVQIAQRNAEELWSRCRFDFEPRLQANSDNG